MRWSYLASVGALAVVLSACSSTPGPAPKTVPAAVMPLRPMAHKAPA